MLISRRVRLTQPGDILEIKLPVDPQAPTKHRNFAFLTFADAADAADAIDNYDLNELPGYEGKGKYLKCSIANPDRFSAEGGGDKFDRPGESYDPAPCAV